MDTEQPQSPEEARKEKQRAKNAARYRANPEKALAYTAAYQRANPEKTRAKVAKYAAGHKKEILLKGARQRAKAKGLEFSVTVESLKWPTHCPVLGVELNYGAGGGGAARGSSPSLDRWNNDLGYTPHNTVVISARANMLKNDGTLEELKRVVWYSQYGRFLPPLGCEDFW